MHAVFKFRFSAYRRCLYSSCVSCLILSLRHFCPWVIFWILMLFISSGFFVSLLRLLLYPHGHSWGLTMRKCGPGGFECAMTFKPANLINAFGLDDAQVTYFLLLNCAFDLHLGETFVARWRCVFWLGVCVVCLFSLFCLFRFVHVASMSHSVSLLQYIRCTSSFVTDGNCPKARR